MNNDTKHYGITCIISGVCIIFFLYLLYIPKFSNNHKQEEYRIYTSLSKDNIAKVNNNFLKIENQIEQNTHNINHIQKSVAIQQNNNIDTPSTKDTDRLEASATIVGPLIVYAIIAKNRNEDNKLGFIINVMLIFIVVIFGYFFHYSLLELVKKYFNWRRLK